MQNSAETRRDFLKRTPILFAAPLALACRADTPAQQRDGTLLVRIKKNAIRDPRSEWWGAADAPQGVSSRTDLRQPGDEPPSLVVSGTVYNADGTPAPNILIYLYHTDVHGIYGRAGEHRHGKYRGWLLTDEKGRYEFTTIMPASYPDSTVAAHIHMTVTSEERREDWIDSILFDGDRFLTERERAVRRGGFDPDGTLRGVRDIKLM
ncbi:MAG: hypothetical protein ACK4S4_13165 [Pyrinomonadaceae bacterium]